MIKAFSYIRFSSNKQSSGDSLRRQLDMAFSYAQRHSLQLDERTYQDLGISGYDKSNLSRGALATFLDAVRLGRIESGTYLLVEQFDRLSRAELSTAVRLLLDLVDAGITVVTLVDERIWDKSTINDMTNLIMSVVLMSRAHEESASKSKRIRAAWAQKRASAHLKIVTSECPRWLAVSEDKSHFLILEDRVESIKKVFALRIMGVGVSAIMTRANRENWPAPSKSSTWHLSLIKRLLCNRSLLGEYQPRVCDPTTGKRVPVGSVLQKYYPQVLDESDFQRAQLVQARNSTLPRRRDKEYRNVLQGLLWCSKCGASIVRKNKTSTKQPGYARYYCTNRVRGITKCPGIPADHLEQTVLHAIATINPRSIDDLNMDLLLARERINNLEAEQASLNTRVERLAEAIASAPTSIPSLTSKLMSDELRLSQIKKELDIARAELTTIDVDHPLEIFNRMKDLISTGDILDRSRLRDTLLHILNRIEVTTLSKTKLLRIHLNPGYYFHGKVPILGVCIRSPLELSELNLFNN